MRVMAVAAAFDRAFVRELYADEVAAIHGWFWLGYATAESVRHVDTRGSRRIDGADDAAALDALRSRVPEEHALDAGFGVSARREYGCFVDNELVCAGTLTPFRETARRHRRADAPASPQPELRNRHGQHAHAGRTG